MKKALLKSGLLLAGSAVISKVLGLLRDRLLVADFAAGAKVDFVFAAFRIPDFFFALLVGGVVSTLFLPRVAHLDEEEKTQFTSSFVWGITVLFGIFCAFGMIFPETLVAIFAPGFQGTARAEISELAQLLFGSVFLLSVSAVFSAALQAKERFFWIAVAPVLYTGSICAGIYLFAEKGGLPVIGWSAIVGGAIHLLSTLIGFFANQGKIGLFWQKPKAAWKNFRSDFSFRFITNASFQINQSADVWIASFLVAGSVSAFSIGTNLGGVLLSILGLSLANAVFPKLSAMKHDPHFQKKVMRHASELILLFTIPTAIIGVVFSKELLQLLFGLSGNILDMGSVVFSWTVASLPAACLIPIFSRLFFANGDTKTPMKISSFSLLVGTALAAFLAFEIFPKDKAVLGLALGTFVANFLSLGLFSFWSWKKFFHPSVMPPTGNLTPLEKAVISETEEGLSEN